MKNNYRKKITLTSQISKMRSELLKKVYPPTVEFKFNINKNRSEKVKQAWTQILDECKQRLTKALLDEMYERYATIKGHISQYFLKLQKILNSKQLQEIRDTLQKGAQGWHQSLPWKHSTSMMLHPTPTTNNQLEKEGRKYKEPQTIICSSLCNNLGSC